MYQNLEEGKELNKTLKIETKEVFYNYTCKNKWGKKKMSWFIIKRKSNTEDFIAYTDMHVLYLARLCIYNPYIIVVLLKT